ncbi:hypothetical protein BH708_13040 [Brachybacterium sp. P6-10-X1]|uniref:hypothetical protein n=1 Tax=Brachybacterium sp. P6-10-X1 TaxID=1903186 RepID=UPI000971B115|nr:hypothetical protein [Brachybacterium sp. P6-10-X1]APX33485.1 hypothetical protein BH708_13040 [Brachybacterium sp. P6-10-X1]
MTDAFDSESAAWEADAASADAAQDPAIEEDTELLAESSEDEYTRPGEEEPGEVSIDDALETDRVVAEGADSRNADGYGFDEDRERGTEDAAAAEQGNRDEDRMESDVDDEELDDLAGSDGDARGTERDLADPEA